MFPACGERFVSVLGEVQHPGAVPLTNNSTLASVLAEAGGFTAKAGNKPHIQIVDPANGTSRIISFNDVLNPAKATGDYAEAGRDYFCAADRLLSRHLRSAADEPDDLSGDYGHDLGLRMTPMHLEPEPMDRLLAGEGRVAPQSTASSAVAAGNGTQAVFRLDLLRSLQLHRKLALGIAIAGLVLAVAYWFYEGPVYQAESIVYIQPSPPRVMPQGPSWPYSQRWPYDSNTYESYITQQIQNVTRADVLAGAVRKLQVRHLAGKRGERPGRGGQVEVGDQGNAPGNQLSIHDRRPRQQWAGRSRCGQRGSGQFHRERIARAESRRYAAAGHTGRRTDAGAEGAGRRPRRTGCPEQATGRGFNREPRLMCTTKISAGFAGSW